MELNRLHVYTHKDRLVFRNNLPSPDELMDKAAPLVRWARAEKCFIYITDSQLLQQFVCGHARLTGGHCDAMFERITGRMLDHFLRKWGTPTMWGDPVVWMARRHNKVADGLADLTMDSRKSWEKSFTTSSPPTSWCRQMGACEQMVLPQQLIL